jgi:site-specific DNA recombinase
MFQAVGRKFLGRNRDMRLALYARVSTERQEKQETIESQLADLHEFTRRQQAYARQDYVDDGFSGELLERPALDRLRDDAKKGLLDAVLVHSPDRLSRKFIHLGLLKEELAKSGAKVIFLNRPETKDTPEDNLLENVQGIIAEYEKAKILERTRRGKIHKAKYGFIVGGRAPYGYKYVPGDKNKREPGRYELVAKEAKVVRLIFRMLVKDGLSVRAIARELTKKGIEPRRGKNWRTSTLHRILRNETYVGVTYYNKNLAIEGGNGNNGNGYRRTKNTSRRLRPKDQWIPIELPASLRIIDDKMFRLAQRQLEINSERSPRNAKHSYLLRGMVRCGSCGSPLYGTPCHGKLYYRCGNRQRTFPKPRECPVGMILAESLENAVWEKICEAVLNPDLIAGQIEKLNQRAKKDGGNLRKALQTLEKDLAATELEENRVLDLYREDLISKEKLGNQLAKVQEKRRCLNDEIRALSTRLDKGGPQGFDRGDVLRYCESMRKRITGLSGDSEGKRRILALLVDNIVLEGRTLRIRGIIPAGPLEKGPNSGRNPCHIASLTSKDYGSRRPRLQRRGARDAGRAHRRSRARRHRLWRRGLPPAPPSRACGPP